jgi:hypothetical protein
MASYRPITLEVDLARRVQSVLQTLYEVLVEKRPKTNDPEEGFRVLGHAVAREIMALYPDGQLLADDFSVIALRIADEAPMLEYQLGGAETAQQVIEFLRAKGRDV